VPRSLVIVESPAKARTIAGFLGADYEVKASIGHIRDLPRSKDEVPEAQRVTHGRLAGIDPDDHFDVVYVVHDDKKKVVAELKRALRGADELILATDEDREGEAISWHVLEVLQPRVPVRRMVFHEITPQAISAALDQPRELDMKLVEAQEGRRILDRLVGWETSPILWRRVSGARSAGRVQSVATRLVVERERARMAFRSGTWWGVDGTFDAHDVHFPAALVEVDGRRLAEGRDFDPTTGRVTDEGVVVLDEDAARALAGRLDGAEFTVASIESARFAERPKPPFTTSTLQQEAGRKLRFGSARTMAVAQRLYERGYITYMRTDSTNLSEQAVTAARSQIRRLYGDEYLPDRPRTYRGRVKNAQEAHEAIRPAGEEIRTPEQVGGELDADERRLYELVWMRTIACQMVDARARRVTLRLAATSTASEAVVFRASGKTYEFLGFRRAYVEDVDEGDAEEGEVRLPDVAEDDPVRVDALDVSGHETKPPARFTEASLVKELEGRGIGRPSTYASVIQTIQDRGYVWKKGSALVPSWTAFAVVRLLEEYFGHLVDYSFTATMEEALDVIARGEGEAEKWLHEFYFGNGQAGLRELVSEDKVASIDVREVNTVPLGLDDDGTPVVVRVGRYGPYVQRGDERASVPPDLAPDELGVGLALELIRRQAQGPQALGEDPETGLSVYVLNGRFGPYVQLGEQEEGTKEKPRRASLFASMSPETVTLEQALELLSLPRVIGVDPDTGEQITAQNGRYGPYLKRGADTRSLEREEDLLTVGLDAARALFAQPKRRGRRTKPPIAELGESPDTGTPVRILDGRFGPYATDGTTNASIPRGRDPESVTLDEALALLRERAAKGPAKKKRPAKKKAPKKRAPAKKKAPAKKQAPAKKRAPAKRAAARTPTKRTARATPSARDAAADASGNPGEGGVGA